MLKPFFFLFLLVTCSLALDEAVSDFERKELLSSYEPRQKLMSSPRDSQIQRVQNLKNFFCFSTAVSFVFLPIISYQTYEQLAQSFNTFNRSCKKSYLGVLFTVFGFSAFTHYKLWEDIRQKEIVLKETE